MIVKKSPQKLGQVWAKSLHVLRDKRAVLMVLKPNEAPDSRRYET